MIRQFHIANWIYIFMYFHFIHIFVMFLDFYFWKILIPLTGFPKKCWKKPKTVKTNSHKTQALLFPKNPTFWILCRFFVFYIFGILANSYIINLLALFDTLVVSFVWQPSRADEWMDGWLLFLSFNINVCVFV